MNPTRKKDLMTDPIKGPVTLYTTSWCGFCRKAIELLEKRGVAHENVDLTGDPEELDRMKTKWKHPTVPIVVIGETLVGGFSELSAMDSETELAHLK
jgi:glutaredoxin 3